MKERTNCSGNSQVPWPQGLVRVQERLSAPVCACAGWWAAGCWAARAGCLGWAAVTAEQQGTCVMARFYRCPASANLGHTNRSHRVSNALQKHEHCLHTLCTPQAKLVTKSHSHGGNKHMHCLSQEVGPPCCMCCCMSVTHLQSGDRFCNPRHLDNDRLAVVAVADQLGLGLLRQL